MSKNLLIIQYRTDASCAHEQACFREDLTDVPLDVTFANAVIEGIPENFSDYDGIILAGSGEFMLGEGDGEGTWKQVSFAFIDKVMNTDVPMLGICFGMQMIALSQGARIINDIDKREAGSFVVTVDTLGKNDDLFMDIPENFFAQFGHKETIVDPPQSLIPLAHTNRVALNTYRVAGKKVWGTVMHPELNPERLAWRLQLFPGYMEGKSLDDIAQTFQPSDDASQILQNFFRIVLE